MREDDLRELIRGAEEFGAGADERGMLRTMAAVLDTDDKMPERVRRNFLRGIVTMYRESGVLGKYLEHEPPEGSVWARFHSLVSNAASEMARERTRRNGGPKC